MCLKFLAGLACCVILAGCDDSFFMKKIVPPEDENIARNYVEMLRRGEIDEIQRKLDAGVAQPDDREKLAQISGMLPAEEPQSSKVVGVRLYHNKEYSTSEITLEYELRDRWLLVRVLTKKVGKESTLLGINATQTADSLENVNRFRLFSGKSAVQYLILAGALFSILFTFYVFVLCARSGPLKMKWLWLVIILFGIGKLSVNWVTGEWAFTPIAIQIPCATAVRPFYGPWTISGSFPLAALLFLNHRWKMKIIGELIPPRVPDSK
jgi:hypothetical protein